MIAFAGIQYHNQHYDRYEYPYRDIGNMFSLQLRG